MEDTVYLKIWHGGFFGVDNRKKTRYFSGEGRTFSVDPDELCGFYLNELVVKCGGYTNIEALYYRVPGMSLDEGLVKVFDDGEVRKMTQLCVKNRGIEIYVIHSGSPAVQTTPKYSPNKGPSSSRPNKLQIRKPPPPSVIKSPKKRGSSSRPDAFVSCSPFKTASSNPGLVFTEPIEQLSNILLVKDAFVTSQPIEAYFPLSQDSDIPHLVPLHAVQSEQLETHTKETQIPDTSLTSHPLNHDSISNVNKPQNKKAAFVVSDVPDDYQWEDNRDDDGDVSGRDDCLHDSERDNSSDEDFDPGLDSDLEDDVNDNWKEGLVDEHLYVEETLEDIQLEEGCETSDDEFHTARQKVKGWNEYIVHLSKKLQEDAQSGRLSSQVKSIVNVRGKNSTAEEGDDGWVSEYDESEEEIHTPPDSEEEDNNQRNRSKGDLVLQGSTNFETFKWKIGQRFPTRHDFREAVAKYGVFQGRNVGFLISNSKRQQRLGVKCQSGCPFRIYGSWDSRRGCFVVKTLKGQHTCVRNMDRNTQLRSGWMAKQLLEVFKSRPHWPAKEIIECIRVAYKVMVKRCFAYKVKYRAHRLLHGSMKAHYNKLGCYIAALKATGEADDVDLVTIDKGRSKPPVFQRFYVCFEGVKKGWVNGCRKVIAVDACFLKTFLGGQLMCAIGRDGNDQMYPVAWAVVEGENNLSWAWFLTKLKGSLSLEDGKGLVILSDEHQSIISGVATVFPSCEHRHCARHIFSNWHKKFRGDEMKLKFWNIVKCYNKADFKEALAELRESDEEAADAFVECNPKLFCRALLSSDAKADVVTNNMVETFNGYIVSARSKHLIDMLEEIRGQLMQRLVVKNTEMKKWSGSICPRIQMKLDKNKDEARHCFVMPSSATLFQVSHHLENLNVDLDARSCTCRSWDMTGIPCCHSIAAIYFCHKNAEDFVDPCYTKAVYARAYEHTIPPLESQRFWPEVDMVLDPPPIKVGPGRPRKNRNKDPYENPKKPGKLTKHGVEMSCSLCHKKGHNKRSCSNKDSQEQPPTQQAPSRKRGRPTSLTAPSTEPEMPLSQQHHQATVQPQRLRRGGRVITKSGRGRGSRGGATFRGGSATGASRGRGRGRGRGRNNPPVGLGVYFDCQGNAVINEPTGSGPMMMSQQSSAVTQPSQASTSNVPL